MLNEKDLVLLEKIQSFFKVGNIRTNKSNNAVCFSVQSVKDLHSVILPHFNKYPLISQKRTDFELFKLVIDMMLNKQHLNLSGLQTIVNIRAAINKGLSAKLKEYFPNTVPMVKPLFSSVSKPDFY